MKKYAGTHILKSYAEDVRFIVFVVFLFPILVKPPLCANFSIRMRSKFCCASSSALTFWYLCNSLSQTTQ